MTIFYLFASVPFFFWIVRNALFWAYLWQLKEYRFDRVIIHLKETSQGRDLFFSPFSLIKWFAIFLYVIVVFSQRLLLPYQIFVVLIYLSQFFLVIKEIHLHLFNKPVLTIKALFITFSTLIIIFLLFFIPFVERFLWLLILDRIIAGLMAIFVFFLSFPTELYQDYIIEKAIKKIRNHKNLLVIAVTGSYGKSSTKDYIAQILEDKFKVLKTKGTNNTPIGIANTIIQGLKKETEIFVVEMGAYRIGEITEMCEIVHPKIGVLTAVSYQHLSLFKDPKNIIKAKYELIKALPKDGISIFSGENKNTVKLFKTTKKKKVLYKVYESGLPKENIGEVSAFNIAIDKNNVQFDVKINLLKITKFKAYLLGIHNIEDILPGLFIANYLGMKDKDIRKAISKLKPIEKTMIYKKTKGVNIIDDTFNANPDAVLAVLKYMRIFKKKKILVLQPMIELGEDAGYEHWRIAREISNICDYLLLTNKNFYKEIEKGIREGEGNCRVETGNSAKLADFIKENTKKEDLVVFEGKEAAFVLNKFF